MMQNDRYTLYFRIFFFGAIGGWFFSTITVLHGARTHDRKKKEFMDKYNEKYGDDAE